VTDRYVRTEDIRGALTGHATTIIDALRIPWNSASRNHHIKCPYPNHNDRHPSWRWDSTNERAFCTCSPKGDDALGVLGKIEGIDFASAKLTAAEMLGRSDLIRTVNGSEWPGDKTNAAGSPHQRQRQQQHVIKSYYYPDEKGAVLFKVDRWGPRKKFSQHPPDGNGGWKKGEGAMLGVRLVPYRLPDLVAAKTGANGMPWRVYILEGEKDVDNVVQRWRVTATTNPMGAGKWRPEFNRYFAGSDAVIIADNDKPGRDHVAKVAAELSIVASVVRAVELGGLDEGCDISDWIEMGGSQSDLETLVELAACYKEDGPPTRGFATKNSNTIMETEFEPLRWTVPGYVPEGLSILAGRQKLGKTWLAIDFSVAVALGGSAMGGIPCTQGDVLYIDLENGERRIKRRLETLFQDERNRPDLSRLQWSTASPDLGSDFVEACELWRQSVPTPTLIVVDVLQRIKPAGNVARNSYENDYSILADLQQWAMESGVSVLVLHHTRKGGADDPLEALSGSNGLSACADSTLVLDRTSAGITLYVRGRDVDEKETALRFDIGRWAILGEAGEIRRSDERTRVLNLLRDAPEPMAPADIADAVGAPKNNVRQLIFKMVKDGEVLKLSGRSRYIHSSRRDLMTPDNIDNADNERPEGQGDQGV
jgi:hypothetical protein